MATALVLIPLLAWTTFHVFWSPRREALAYPFLIWVTALGCFVPLGANDYSLVFLPIAALAVWDQHDPVFVHVGLVALLFWWQPFGLPIDGSVLLASKWSDWPWWALVWRNGLPRRSSGQKCRRKPLGLTRPG